MTTRIDRAVTEVVAEPEPTAGSPGRQPGVREAGELRWLLDRLRREERRTRAEGFDD